MQVGMLWYDNDVRRNLEEKVARAVAYYQTKYGSPPTDCFVNPGSLTEGATEVAAGVRLHAANTILKNHFWLGLNEQANIVVGRHRDVAKPAEAAPKAAARPTKKPAKH